MNGSAKTAVVLSTLFIFFGFSADIFADTIVSGDLEGDTTWNLSGSPYYVTSYINFGAINPGATLTIEPGVEVLFSPGAGLNIFGDLLAKGVQDLGITFKPTVANGNWQINIFDSLSTYLSFITTESFQSTVATHNSNIDIDQLVSESKLTLFDGVSNIRNINLTNNQLYIGGGTAIVDQLNINGSGSNFYDSSITLRNATINQTNDLPAIVITDGSATLENIYIDGASYGIIANSVPDLDIRNVNIKNVSEDGLNFDGGMANLRQVSIENSHYGAVLQGSALGLTNFYVRNTQYPSLQTNAEVTTITDSSFTDGQSIGISVNGGMAEMENVTIKNFANAPAFLPNVEDLQGNKLVITDNLFGIYNYGSSTISQSKITNNIYAGAVNNGSYLDARNNYWGHVDGPTLDPMNPDTIHSGDGIIGDVLYEPWLTEYCESDCHSNIMFLPGIMGSRLYEDGEQLWEADEGKISQLYLNENGGSVSDRIVTKDLVDTFDGPVLLDKDIYKSFLEDLEEIKTNGVINNYEAIPYDWRLSLQQILSSGIEDAEGNLSYIQDTTDPYIKKTLRELATSSKSGKVTIVAHSNGGLLTKALINSLGEEAASLIDKIVLVAVPQLGTPQAIGALLHGYDSGIPFVLSDEAARGFAKNAPMSYQLLPFSDYYDGEGHTISTPYVTFEEGNATQTFVDQYGYAITPGELRDFLTGAEGRNEPVYDDTYNLAIANSDLFDNAKLLQESIDSSWIPPEGIKVHQVAGVGEYTPASIHYKTIQKCKTRVVVCVGGYEDIISYDVEEAIDGDGTVVLPSALAMSDNVDEIEKWWVNLYEYNDTIINSLPLTSFLRTGHADILEIDEVRSFILEQLITSDVIELPDYISSTLPELNEEDRLVFTLHSPLSLSAITSDGKVVSKEEISIPGAHYARYGEIQKLSIPNDLEFTLVLTGESEGSFTLEGVEIEDDEVTETISFSAIPSSTSTVAEIEFGDGSIEDSSSLLVDYDGNGTVEASYTPIPGDIVTTPDLVVTETTIQTGGTTSGGSRSIPKVAGASTEAINYYEILLQLQLIINRLEQMKQEGLITDVQYNLTKSEIDSLLNLLDVLLNGKLRK